MKRVITAVVLIALVLWALFKAPLWVPWLLSMAVALLAQEEYLSILEQYQLEPSKWILRFFSFMAFASAVIGRTSLIEQKRMDSWTGIVLFFAIYTMLCGIALLIAALQKTDFKKSFLSAAATFFSTQYIVLPMLWLVTMLDFKDGQFWVFFTLLIVWSGDICGLYVGKQFGKKPLAPRISPQKTWEGTYASVAGSMAAGTIWFVVCYRQIVPVQPPLFEHIFNILGMVDTNDFLKRLVAIMFYSAIVNIFSQFGDLAESMLKRGVDMKDSGTILPGHGGMLDRIDALLFAIPVAYLIRIF